MIPGGTFESIDIVHGGFDCGIKTGGSAVCWNGFEQTDYLPPAGATFTSVSPGAQHVCGVKPDSSVICWGTDSQSYGILNPPGGSVKFWGDDSEYGIAPTGRTIPRRVRLYRSTRGGCTPAESGPTPPWSAGEATSGSAPRGRDRGRGRIPPCSLTDYRHRKAVIRGNDGAEIGLG